MLHRFVVFMALLLSSVTIATDDSINDTLFKHHANLAENGDSESMYIVANMYESGKGVSVDFREAIKWYQSSAMHGNTLAGTMIKRVDAKMRSQFDDDHMR